MGPALGYGETLGTKCKGTQKLRKQARSFFNTILLEIKVNAEKPTMNKFNLFFRRAEKCHPDAVWKGFGNRHFMSKYKE